MPRRVNKDGRTKSGTSSANLNDTAYESIKQDVISCKLVPGEAVSETLLAARFGLGKAPIRNALARLSQDRLVRSVPRQGYVITPITIEDVQEIFQLRLMLEPRAARLAAGRLSGEQLMRLKETCKVRYRPGDRESQTRFLSANKQFHVAIAEAAGNNRLTVIIAQLLNEVERMLHMGLRNHDLGQHFQHEHKDLLDALMAGEGEAAERMVYEQIKGGQDMVVEGLLHGAPGKSARKVKGSSLDLRAPQRAATRT
jgi:DNA-binding GntR family transcriptional regulator